MFWLIWLNAVICSLLSNNLWRKCPQSPISLASSCIFVSFSHLGLIYCLNPKLQVFTVDRHLPLAIFFCQPAANEAFVSPSTCLQNTGDPILQGRVSFLWWIVRTEFTDHISYISHYILQICSHHTASACWSGWLVLYIPPASIHHPHTQWNRTDIVIVSFFAPVKTTENFLFLTAKGILLLFENLNLITIWIFE